MLPKRFLQRDYPPAFNVTGCWVFMDDTYAKLKGTKGTLTYSNIADVITHPKMWGAGILYLSSKLFEDIYTFESIDLRDRYSCFPVEFDDELPMDVAAIKRVI